MKIFFRILSFAIVILFLLIISVFLYTNYFIKPPLNMTPEETIEYYFKNAKEKKYFKMISVVYNNKRNETFDLLELEELNLISCEEKRDFNEESFSEEWYSNPYQIAEVDVNFEIVYKKGYDSGFDNGKVKWSYNLVKKNENSPWIIVMWGAG